jgi:hypothetical protein
MHIRCSDFNNLVTPSLTKLKIKNFSDIPFYVFEFFGAYLTPMFPKCDNKKKKHFKKCKGILSRVLCWFNSAEKVARSHLKGY